MKSFTDGDNAGLRWVNEWSAEVDEQAEQAVALAGQVVELTATACSRDGVVEVTINSAGVLTGLRFDDSAVRWRAHDLAAEVMVVLRQAHENLAERVGWLVDDTVGADSPTGQAVARGFADRVVAVGGAPAADTAADSGWHSGGNGGGRGW